jgi:hypothetical protein
MRRALIVMVLVAASCGGADPVVSSGADASEGGDLGPPLVSSTGDAPAASPDGASLPSVPEDAPPAPDFTLALAGGGDFVLGDEQKPVYLIFWAEW